jgi:hypothetical protein
LKDKWVGSNVDLTALSKSIVEFFTDNKFETKLEGTKDDFKIVAANPLSKIKVNIYGKPNDFTVEFLPDKKSQGFSLSMILGQIASLIGAGGLLLRDVKLQESQNILERLFWKHVDEQVAGLTNSAT